MKILIVENEKTTINIIKTAFNNNGYVNLDIANDGIRALKMAKKEEYNLIITALDIPKLNGTNFINAYKSNGGKSPVLILEVPMHDFIKNKVKKLGIMGWVNKPFKTTALISIVQLLENKIGKTAEKRQLLSDILNLLDETDTSSTVEQNKLFIIIKEKINTVKYLLDKDLLEDPEIANRIIEAQAEII
jgi:two-component system, chemotaxis family, chemotaxis protein CheY